MASESKIKFMDFPFVSAPCKNLLVDLVSTVENRFDSQLLPCTVPENVRYFRNQNSTAQGSLHIRSGHNSSNINYMLGSWMHCELPTGGAMNTTSLTTSLNPSTDAPNFLVELIETSPTSLTLVLDLCPRKDLVLNPDYLKVFYQDTQLDLLRQEIEKIPEFKPYVYSALYIRTVFSPVAILAKFEAETPERITEIVKTHVDPIARKALGIWIDKCACGERDIGEEEKDGLKIRDRMIKSNTLDSDLDAAMPLLLGAEVAERVVSVIRSYIFK